MNRRWISISLWLLCAPALAADPALIYSEWSFLRDPATPAVSFSEGLRFLNRHADWPDIKIIRLRTEAAAMREAPDASLLAPFCAAYPPISGRGMLACAEGGYPNAAARTAAIHQAWLQGDFSPFEEKMILTRHADTLRAADHEQRVDRLLYERKSDAAKRMLPLLSARQQHLTQARLALQSRAKDANAKLAQVPSSLKNHVGLLLDRARWRQQNGMRAEMRTLLATSPRNPPYADAWWTLRVLAVREALQAAQYDQALAIIARHGALKSEFLAEALWLKGWITLERKRDAATAYKDFFKLYNSVSTPVSLARGAYWAAQAAARNGNDAIARNWLQKAAEHPTVFYGQLAHAELLPGAPLKLSDAPAPSASARAAFARRELPQVVRMLAQTGDNKMADHFLAHLASQAATAEEFALLADLAVRMNAAHGGVVIAKLALRKGIVLARVGWPTMQLPANLPIEPALALAIARQESEFDPAARSSANAQGLMQLLPATGRDTARKIGLSASPLDLFDPSINVALGSAYLGRLIDAYDGSYIQAIAAYNAGVRNVGNWRDDYGPPPANVAGAVDWIENIPFGETRNYVQRVLENVQVYRQLSTPSQAVALPRDLTR